MAPQQAAAEMERRLSSRAWRLSNLYMIRDAQARIVRFQPNDIQQQLERDLWWRNIILKARQEGVTTYAIIRGLDKALFVPGSRIGIVAHTDTDAKKFFRDKLLFAHEHLPDWLTRNTTLLRVKRLNIGDGELELTNGSVIYVSLSHRGGTLTDLHVSEYGPMGLKFPLRASEVKEGALNTIAPEGTVATIESTAAGSQGDFYQMCRSAMALDRLVRAGQAKLTRMDYRFHFFAWWRDPKYKLDPRDVFISKEMHQYFEEVEDDMAIHLSPHQRAWYVKKAQEQGDAMHREFPSTPDEAFSAAVEGAYFTREIAECERTGRICELPIHRDRPVHTFWDLGHDDATAIWLMQEDGPWRNFVAYHEDSGWTISHYATWLLDWAKEHGVRFGKHYLPHDVENVDLGQQANDSRLDILEGLGIQPVYVVPRSENLAEDIDLSRRLFARSRFDVRRCGEPEAGQHRGGLNALRNFRREYNQRGEAWMSTPARTWAKHGADAYRQAAQAFLGEEKPERPDQEERRRKRERERARGWKTA